MLEALRLLMVSCMSDDHVRALIPWYEEPFREPALGSADGFSYLVHQQPALRIQTLFLRADHG